MAYYTCLLLDVDNTLLDFDAAERQALTETLIRYDLPHDEEALSTYHTVNRRLWDQLAKGEVTRNKLFAIRFGQYLKAMGLPDAGKGREMNDVYEKALATHADLLPGALTGLFLAAGAFSGMMLFAWAVVWPSLGSICIYLFSWLLFFAISLLYWPQLVLFEQKNTVRLRNVLLFAIQYFLPALGTAALQLVYWLVVVLFAPWTLLLMPFVAIWFILFAVLFLLYDKLDAAFEIENRIAGQFPDQPARRE